MAKNVLDHAETINNFVLVNRDKLVVDVNEIFEVKYSNGNNICNSDYPRQKTEPKITWNNDTP